MEMRTTEAKEISKLETTTRTHFSNWQAIGKNIWLLSFIIILKEKKSNY